MKQITMCFYCPDPIKKRDAHLLVKVLGRRSLSGLIWELLERLIDEHRSEIDELKALEDRSKNRMDDILSDYSGKREAMTFNGE